MNWRHPLIIAGIILFVALGAHYSMTSYKNSALMTFSFQETTMSSLEAAGTKPVRETAATPDETVRETEEMTVYVGGAVLNPGIYPFQEGDRVYDVVEKARPDQGADFGAMHLAERLKNGDRIHVPKISETTAAPHTQTGGEPRLLININTASSKTLMSVPGINERIADAIVKYREENGAFKHVDDLLDVVEVGEWSFNQAKPHITAK